MEENHLTTNKTARFYTHGELNKKTKQVWIMLHGHGHNAKAFLSSFEPLFNESIFFIAPEGLNKYYLKGYTGEVGATWMTKDDRLNEIKDYINYLDRLYKFLLLDEFTVNITGFGFSQGTSTLTRWIDATGCRIDKAIVYAGDVAPELLPLKESSGLRQTKNFFICGNEDNFFPPERVSQMKAAYKELNFTEIDFEGGHEIKTEVLHKFFV